MTGTGLVELVLATLGAGFAAMRVLDWIDARQAGKRERMGRE